ncbi:MAG: ABC transporter permease [Ruminiclostridium sp.]|nr:ABC transporter permease [Ruminiclostridium sp.]MBP3521540.1 ABC transporter permease [Oscillospiraceae bacterium]
MRNGIITIMRKELARFFGDKRLVVSILLPGVLVYVMYSFMGSAMGSNFGVDEDYTPTVQAVNLPASMEALLPQTGFSIVTGTDVTAAKESVTAQDLDLLLVFPDGFDQTVAAYQTSSGTAAPNVELYYNSASTNSTYTYQTITALLDAYEASMVNKFDVNAGNEGYDLATREDSMGSLFAMLMPMLLMTFLYSGCAAVAPESIAGEKERGTIATMLITPIRRGDIALGKILALGIISTISAAASAIGTILAMPKLMGAAAEGMSTDIYGVTDYLLLAAVIFSTVLVLVTLISILSAFAKTIKEAQTYAMPVMLLSMGLGLSGMFGGGASQDLWAYCIPLYNSVQCMTGVFSFSILPMGVALTVAVNAVVTLLGVFVLAKMFNSEKIIFAR